MDIHVEVSADSGKCPEFQREVTTHWQPLTFRWYLGLDKRRGPTWMVEQRKGAAKGKEQIGEPRKGAEEDACKQKRVVNDVPDRDTGGKHALCTVHRVCSCQASLCVRGQ